MMSCIIISSSCNELLWHFYGDACLSTPIYSTILFPVLETIQENGIEVMPVDLAEIQNLITHFKRLLLSELISLTENDHNGKRNINKIIILKCLISSKKMSLKKYSKQTVAVHLYLFSAQGCKCYANYMLQSPYSYIHCTWCIIELYSEALMTQTNDINCMFFFFIFLFLSWCKKKEKRLLQMEMLVGQYILNTSPEVIVFA